VVIASPASLDRFQEAFGWGSISVDFIKSRSGLNFFLFVVYRNFPDPLITAALIDTK
jgi:hypothetical protein